MQIYLEKKINKCGFKFIWICLRFEVKVENIEINLQYTLGSLNLNKVQFGKFKENLVYFGEFKFK